MIDVIIREERQKDFEKINQVVKAAFKNVEQTDHTEHLLVERLRKSQAYIPALSLVAQTPQGEIVGHLLLKSKETRLCRNRAFGTQRLLSEIRLQKSITIRS